MADEKKTNDSAEAEQAIRDAEAKRLENEAADTGRSRQAKKNEAASAEQARINNRAAAQKAAEEESARITVERMRQDYEAREKLRPMPPITQSVTAVTARPDEECVKMMFPRPMFIWAEPVKDTDEPHLKKRYKVSFNKGVQLVPASLADNYYLKLCGVQRLDDIGNERDPKKGPTIQEWVAGGYDARKYPPSGYESRSTKEEVDEAVQKQDNSRFDKGAAA